MNHYAEEQTCGVHDPWLALYHIVFQRFIYKITCLVEPIELNMQLKGQKSRGVSLNRT